MASIYFRQKNEEGRWRYQRVKAGRRRATPDTTFHVRYRKPDGTQAWSPAYKTFEAAAADAASRTQQQAVDAQDNDNRTLIAARIEEYLDGKRNKSPRTVAKYAYILNEFAGWLSRRRIRFVDQLADGKVLNDYQKEVLDQKHSPKTVVDKMSIICFAVKQRRTFQEGIENPTQLLTSLPTVEEEDVQPYESKELDRLFKAMTEEEYVAFLFFRLSGCREKEVAFAEWVDIKNGEYHVHSKPEHGFTVKNHEDRYVPLPIELLDLLKERKTQSQSRWIFPNENGDPEGHFLRHLKKIALRAGLNCGHCKTTVTRGRYDSKHRVEVTCKTDPVCEHWYLHRLRKTCADRWLEVGISVRKIQEWLGHKSLETTQIYLTGRTSEEDRKKVNAAARS